MPTTTASDEERISTREYVRNHRYFHKKEREAVSKLYLIVLVVPSAYGRIRLHCWGHTWTESFRNAKKEIDRHVVNEISRRISQ
jgi:hypothetical protein